VHSRRQVRDLGLQFRHLPAQLIQFGQPGVQRRDLRVFLVQQLPRPGIGSAQRGSIIGHAARRRHQDHPACRLCPAAEPGLAWPGGGTTWLAAAARA